MPKYRSGVSYVKKTHKTYWQNDWRQLKFCVTWMLSCMTEEETKKEIFA